MHASFSRFPRRCELFPLEKLKINDKAEIFWTFGTIAERLSQPSSPSHGHLWIETFGCAGRLQPFLTFAAGPGGLTPNGPHIVGIVAGTFHVPSAVFRLTAHGMCLRLSKVSAIGLTPPRSPVSFMAVRSHENQKRPFSIGVAKCSRYGKFEL